MFHFSTSFVGCAGNNMVKVVFLEWFALRTLDGHSRKLSLAAQML